MNGRTDGRTDGRVLPGHMHIFFPMTIIGPASSSTSNFPDARSLLSRKNDPCIDQSFVFNIATEARRREGSIEASRQPSGIFLQEAKSGSVFLLVLAVAG